MTLSRGQVALFFLTGIVAAIALGFVLGPAWGIGTFFIVLCALVGLLVLTWSTDEYLFGHYVVTNRRVLILNRRGTVAKEADLLDVKSVPFQSTRHRQATFQAGRMQSTSTASPFGNISFTSVRDGTLVFEFIDIPHPESVVKEVEGLQKIRADLKQQAVAAGICFYCKTPIRQTTTFCWNCGKKVR